MQRSHRAVVRPAEAVAIRRALTVSMLLIAGCAPKPPEQQIVDDAAAALGGRARIEAVRALTVQGEGTNGNLGQDMTMEASGELFVVTEYTKVLDVAAGASRTEQVRTPNFAYFQGPQPQKQVFGVSPDGVAYSVAANGNATRASEAIGRDRIADAYHHPLTIVRAALDPGAKLSNARVAGNERVVDVETRPRTGGASPGKGMIFTLAIDSTTKLPTRVVSMTDNPNLGDVAIETTFGAYQDVSGLKLPAQFTVKTDRYQTATLKVTKQTASDQSANLAAPPAAAAAAPQTGPPAPVVTVEPVAKGVWFLAGQSHHSVVVEFADHLTLIEAPQSEARALAVIARARELVPGKPLTELVNTHHHFDHSAGLRAAIAEGLTVVTDKGNAAFFQEAATRSHTIVPDALARNPKPAKIIAVDGQMTLKDATATVELYHIDGCPHGDTLLMAYLPRDRVLVEVDAYSPGSAVQPYAANLLENVTRRSLKIDRIVPLHGAIGSFADFVKAVPRS